MERCIAAPRRTWSAFLRLVTTHWGQSKTDEAQVFECAFVITRIPGDARILDDEYQR